MQRTRVQDPAQRGNDDKGYNVQAETGSKFNLKSHGIWLGFDSRDRVREYIVRLDAFDRVDSFLEHVLERKRR